MGHFYFFYFLAAFSVGLVVLAAAAVLFLKTRERTTLYFLFFYGAFTLSILSNLLLTYVLTSLTPDHPVVRDSFVYIEAMVAKYLLMFTLPVFAHVLFSVPNRGSKNIFFGVIALTAFVAQHFSEYGSPHPSVDQWGDFVEDVVFLLVVIYCFLTGLRYCRRQKGPNMNLAKHTTILIGLSLPGITNDLFLTDYSPIRFFPILYCAFGVLYAAHFIKELLSSSSRTFAATPEEEERFLKNHGLSQREIEVASLILRGYGNKQIGDTLSISLFTVKTHVRNIYAKLGVTSRWELMNRVRDAQSTNH